jgi:hypothetical protein
MRGEIMNTYRVTVSFLNVDSENMRYTDRVTEWVDARNEHMACLLVGASCWADETDNITNVHAVIEVN